MTHPPDQWEPAFNESGSATLAALLHLLRLVSAELVLMPGGNIDHFEQAIRSKIDQFPSPTANPRARDAGLLQARHLVDQVLLQIRAQAELKKSLASSAPVATKSPGEASEAPMNWRLLN